MFFNFPYTDFVFIIPFVFGAFGFLKKAFKKVKNVVGGALSFVPGGGLIKQGLGVAKFGIGAIIREVKGKKPQTFRQPPASAQPGFATSSSSSAFSGFGQPTILGINRNIVFALTGAVLVGFIFFNKKR